MNHPASYHMNDGAAAAQLKGVLDIALDGIIIFDASGTILTFNRTCERLFGYHASAAMRSNIVSLFYHESEVPLDALSRQKFVVSSGLLAAQTREIQARHKSGDEFPVELTVGIAATLDGIHFIAIVRDLRSRKEVADRLDRLQADHLHLARVSAIDEMGAALAHELNQPLTAVLLYLQTILRGGQKGDAARDMPPGSVAILAKAAHEAERAGKIIQRMRSFAEKREPQRKLHDVKALIDDAIELTLVGNHTKVRIVRRDAPDLPPLLVDGVQFQQIIVNLGRNAMEAVRGRPAAEIRIETKAIDDDIIIEIADNGPGIPVDILPSLFKVFSTSKRSGLGIGLAISRSIAQNHGGELQCLPGGKGEGATFVLRLPSGQPAAMSPTPSVPVTTSGEVERAK